MGIRLGIRAAPQPPPALRAVSIFWVCWACVWTLLVVAGMAYLIVRRNTPLLRIRGLGLSLAAIILLHIYWISVQIGIIVGPMAPAPTEFWIMGIYFPFGIALFHASNSRFLHVAKAQKKFAQRGSSVTTNPPENRRKRGIVGRFRSLDYTSKVIAVVGVGMLFQVGCLHSSQTARTGAYSDFLVSGHSPHVSHFSQIPSVLGNPRY